MRALFSVLLLSSLLLSSCGKNDSSTTGAMLLGTWKLVRTNNASFLVGTSGYTYTVSFASDATGEEQQTESTTTFSDTYNYSWSVSGNTLTVVTSSFTGTNGTKSSLEGTDSIASITTTTMTILHPNHSSSVRDSFMYVRQ